MARVETIRGLDALEALAPVWDELLAASEEPCVFQSHAVCCAEWAAAGWDSPGTPQPMALVVRDGGEITGIVPLMRRRTREAGIPARAITGLGDLRMRQGLLSGPDPDRTMEVLLDHLLAERTWDQLQLDPVPEDSRLLARLGEGCRRRRLALEHTPRSRSPYIPVDGRLEDYLATRSKNFHKQLANKQNRMKRSGGYECRQYRSEAEVREVLPVIFDIDARSWKGTEGTALASTPASRAFFTDLSLRLARQGQLSLWILWLDGQPIAFEYHLVFGGVVSSMKWSYDQAFHKLSPGLVLKRASTEHFWRRGDIHEIDLLGRSDDFKRKWTERERATVVAHVFHRTPYARLLHAYRFRARPFARTYVLPAISRARAQSRAFGNRIRKSMRARS